MLCISLFPSRSDFIHHTLNHVKSLQSFNVDESFQKGPETLKLYKDLTPQLLYCY